MNRTENDDYEIDLIELFKALCRKALVIILVAALGASVAFAYTLFFISPSYSAEVSFYVNNSSFSLGSSSFTISNSELTASNNLVNTYNYILKSRTTLEDVIAKGSLRYSYETLGKMITTRAVSGTAAFDVTVKSSNPIEAEQIANVIAEVLPERIGEIVDGSSVRIVDYAIVPSHRSSPSYSKNTAIGFLIGAALAAGLVLVKFLIDQKNDVVIHSSDELRELYPNVKVLAMIPDMRLSSRKGYYYSSYYGEEKKGGR